MDTSSTAIFAVVTVILIISVIVIILLFMASMRGENGEGYAYTAAKGASPKTLYFSFLSKNGDNNVVITANARDVLASAIVREGDIHHFTIPLPPLEKVKTIEIHVSGSSISPTMLKFPEVLGEIVGQRVYIDGQNIFIAKNTNFIMNLARFDITGSRSILDPAYVTMGKYSWLGYYQITL